MCAAEVMMQFSLRAILFLLFGAVAVESTCNHECDLSNRGLRNFNPKTGGYECPLKQSQTLNLSHNRIRVMPPHGLWNLSCLEVLDLSDNFLLMISREHLNTSSHLLQAIYLQDNQLVTFDLNIFHGHDLTVTALDLRDNAGLCLKKDPLDSFVRCSAYERWIEEDVIRVDNFNKDGCINCCFTRGTDDASGAAPTHPSYCDATTAEPTVADTIEGEVTSDLRAGTKSMNSVNNDPEDISVATPTHLSPDNETMNNSNSDPSDGVPGSPGTMMTPKEDELSAENETGKGAPAGSEMSIKHDIVFIEYENNNIYVALGMTGLVLNLLTVWLYFRTHYTVSCSVHPLGDLEE